MASSMIVKNMGLPSVLRCYRCKKEKALINFANSRLQEFKHRGGVGSRYELLCLLCTTGVSGPKTELKCSRCDAIKPVTAFAKTQRARDEPECQKCTKERLTEGDSDGGSEASSISNPYDSASDGDAWPGDTPSTLTAFSKKSASTMADSSGGVLLPPTERSTIATTSLKQVVKQAEPAKTREVLKDVAAQVSDSEDSN